MKRDWDGLRVAGRISRSPKSMAIEPREYRRQTVRVALVPDFRIVLEIDE